MRTAEMFPKIHTPRRVLMHVVDAGTISDHETARFECRACGHETGWLTVTRSQGRRGIPCPNCNGAASTAECRP